MAESVEPTGTELPASPLLGRLATVDRWWALVVVVLATIVLLIRSSPDPFGTMFQFLSDGILVTLKITLTSFVTVLIVGLFGGLGRLSRNWFIKGLASLYVEVVRGIPLLVQLLFIWFALPQVLDTAGGWLVNIWPAASQWLIDLKLQPFSAAVLGITICYGAYMSEIYRAGIQSIHHGQMEAARSLGMSYVQAMRFVVLPQAIRVILPPVGNEFVTLLKDSSLVSVLAVSDLTRRGREYMARTFMSFETWMMVALIYLVLTLTFTRIATAIERKMSIER
jgi:polar amino acid transport system permease protein